MMDFMHGTSQLTGCDEILVASDGPVRIVTLNNPGNANAVNNAMHGAFARLWTALGEDADARAVLITGTGDYFSAGGNLVEWLETHVNNPVTRREGMRDARRIVRDMIDFPLPIVAAVNGPAVGFGCSIAVLCDIVLMSDRAFFADTHVASGLVAGDGGSVLWPLLMSLLKAKEYLLLGERIKADKAVELGLANRVVPHDEIKQEGLVLAHRLAALPARAVQDTKRTLNLHAERAVTAILEFGISAETECFTTPEHRAAIDKFLNRG
jgi:enoyl-CoA hydratase